MLSTHSLPEKHFYRSMGQLLLLLPCLFCLLGCGPDADEQQGYELLRQTMNRGQQQLALNNRRRMEDVSRFIVRQGNRATEIAVRTQADELLHLADSVMALLEETETGLGQLSAAHSGKAGTVARYLKGNAPDEPGKLLPLYQALRRFESRLLNLLKITNLPLPSLPGPYGTPDAVYRGSAESFNRQFAHITPHEAMLLIAQLKARVAFNAFAGLENLISKVGGHSCWGFLNPAALASTQVVPVGSRYQADVVLVVCAQQWYLRSASINGKTIEGNPGLPNTSRDSFVAANGTKGGNKQYWEAHFILNSEQGADTTMVIRRPYWVYPRNASLPSPPQP